MSVEQWGFLALVVLLPLLEGVARLRRAHASRGETTERLGEVRASRRGIPLPIPNADGNVVRAAKQMTIPPPSLPPPLPQPVTTAAKSLYGLPASRASSLKSSASLEAHTGAVTPVADNAVMPWLRPVGNLRRAIVMATILGPPTQ